MTGIQYWPVLQAAWGFQAHSQWVEKKCWAGCKWRQCERRCSCCHWHNATSASPVSASTPRGNTSHTLQHLHPSTVANTWHAASLVYPTRSLTKTWRTEPKQKDVWPWWPAVSKMQTFKEFQDRQMNELDANAADTAEDTDTATHLTTPQCTGSNNS